MQQLCSDFQISLYILGLAFDLEFPDLEDRRDIMSLRQADEVESSGMCSIDWGDGSISYCTFTSS